jgi:murein L,D-transpeptidase YcbB/YkuD
MRYRELEKSNSLITVPNLSKSAVLKINDHSPVIPAIKKQLYLLGYTKATDTTNVFDTSLAGAVAGFKITHGLKGDSLITGSMIKELNTPVKIRIEQIMVNMERLRWVPGDSATREFILVNIPAFTLYYYEDKKVAWECNVVVGKPMTKTVIFSGQMQYVVFSPYWNVPPSIINKEIKPGMKKNPNYLARHNMEWNGGRVRQKPGPRNSLGLVKFLFPNSNNIYLHDSPSKSLYNEAVRAFSHGCIRVSKPKDLAMRVLRQDPSWTSAKIDAAMHAGVEKYVTLKNKIPVYIGYFTCFIDENGNVNFRKDIYDRDNRLLDMLIND